MPARAPEPRPQPRRRTAPSQRDGASLPVARPEWRGFEALLALALVGTSILVTMTVLGSPLADLLPSVGKIGVRTILIFTFYGVQLIALAFFAHRRHVGFSALYRLPMRFDHAVTVRKLYGGSSAELTASQRARTWLAATAWVLGTLIVLRIGGVFWTLVTEGIGWLPPSGELADLFGRSTFGLVLAVVTVVVAGPFVEELVFRVVIQGWLRRRLTEPLAVGFTAVLFALSHLSWWALIPNIALGVATGLLASRRDTIWPAIVLHSLHNATLVAAAFFFAA